MSAKIRRCRSFNIRHHESGRRLHSGGSDCPGFTKRVIFHNCAVKVLIIEARLADGLSEEFKQLGFAPELIVIDGVGGGVPLAQALERLDSGRPGAISRPAPFPNYPISPTSSILQAQPVEPKGVMLSHGNAACFIDWCSDVFKPNEHDRFSSHAPFHFDLSILDIYVSLKHGATLVIVEEQLGKEPARLAPWIAEKKLTVWYSAPSILSLLAQFGKLEQHDYSSLRLVLIRRRGFSYQIPQTIEVIVAASAIFQSSMVQRRPTSARFTKYRSVIPESQNEPVPIGKACPYCRAAGGG